MSLYFEKFEKFNPVLYWEHHQIVKVLYDIINIIKVELDQYSLKDIEKTLVLH